MRNQKSLVLLGFISLAILVTALWVLIKKPSHERPVELTLTGGNSKGLRHKIANSICESISTQNEHVRFKVIPSSGSVDSIQKVDAGKLDLALIQGGINVSEFPNIREVSVLHVEPLHLLIKSNETVPNVVQVSDIANLLSKFKKPRVNFSTKGSGTNILAKELFQFFALDHDDFQITSLSYDQLMDPNLTLQELPEAILVVSSMPSPVVKYLIDNKSYRLAELPVSKAFRIEWASESESRQKTLQRRFVVETEIPAYTYSVNPPIPDRPIKTLGTRMHLIAHKDVPASAIESVADALYKSSFANISNPPLNVDLLADSSEYALHDGASNYLKKKTPIATEHVVELTEQLIAITGAVFGGILFVWQAMLFIRRRRRDRQFLLYISRVGEIEQKAMEFETKSDMDFQDLVHLQAELTEIKSEMISQFKNGDIDGADTLSSFLMQVNDANENLTRMILHERNPKSTTHRS